MILVIKFIKSGEIRELDCSEISLNTLAELQARNSFNVVEYRNK